MAELTNRKALLDSFKSKLEEKRKEDLDRLTAEQFKNYLSGLPSSERRFVGKDGHQHGGHIFEVWLTGLEKAGASRLPLTSRVLSRFQSARSGDKTAAAAGRGSQKHTRHTSRIQVSAARSAKFISKVENGGTIRVGEGRALKGSKLSGEIGRLYGRRAKVGQGWLMFRRGGRVVFRKVHTFSSPSDGVGAFSGAKSAVASLAQSLGWVQT